VGGLDFRIPSANALVLADDSGLEVDALQGAPGVHSARFAALDGRAATAATTNSADASNNAKLLGLLKEVPEGKRQARFRCALASIRVKPPQSVLAGQTFEGTCEGRIQSVARGQGGFGYDSLFVPLGYNQSFAELSAGAKNQISHRAQALQKFKRYLDTLGL
jgi:XTP/dITP diphosphohydrolase